MAQCPHCDYEGDAATFGFESARADTCHRTMDHGIISCPRCGVVLGGYSFKKQRSP